MSSVGLVTCSALHRFRHNTPSFFFVFGRCFVAVYPSTGSSDTVIKHCGASCHFDVNVKSLSMPMWMSVMDQNRVSCAGAQRGRCNSHSWAPNGYLRCNTVPTCQYVLTYCVEVEYLDDQRRRVTNCRFNPMIFESRFHRRVVVYRKEYSQGVMCQRIGHCAISLHPHNWPDDQQGTDRSKRREGDGFF